MMRIAFGDEEIDLVRADELLIKGEHNVANALAASAAAVALGADVSAVKAGLRSFGALEHRIEPAGEIDGVACYNDSKATNVDAVLKALVAFRPVKPYILLGDATKGPICHRWSPLAPKTRAASCASASHASASSRLSPRSRSRAFR